jgi:hypothetical protein
MVQATPPFKIMKIASRPSVGRFKNLYAYSRSATGLVNRVGIRLYRERGQVMRRCGGTFGMYVVWWGRRSTDICLLRECFVLQCSLK